MANNPSDDGGYKPAFLGQKFKFNFPVLNDDQKNDLLKFQGNKFRLNHIHYTSVIISVP